jgi:hypothetical protein
MKKEEVIQVIEEMIKCSIGNTKMIQALQHCLDMLKGEPTVGEIQSTIHQTREWQSLHLEVVPEILENVKIGLAQAIKDLYDGRRDERKHSR